MYAYAHARPVIVVDLFRRGSVIVFGAFSIVWISNDSEPARRTSPVFVRACMYECVGVTVRGTSTDPEEFAFSPAPLLFTDRWIFREFYSRDCSQNRNFKVFVIYRFISTLDTFFIAFLILHYLSQIFLIIFLSQLFQFWNNCLKQLF